MKYLKLFLLCGFLLNFSASALAEEAETFRIYSPDEQYLVYSSNPKQAQEVSLLAQSIRTQLFDFLGWMVFNQYPTEIWILDEKPSLDFPPVLSSISWFNGEWQRKISALEHPKVAQEYLPREIVRLSLLELANESAQGKKTGAVEALPLWLIEALYLKVTSPKIMALPSKKIKTPEELKELLQTNFLPTSEKEYQAFGQTALLFLEDLLQLPDGKQKLKNYIRLIGTHKKKKKQLLGKPFFKIYKSDYKNQKVLLSSWQPKESPQQSREQTISQYLDQFEK